MLDPTTGRPASVPDAPERAPVHPRRRTVTATQSRLARCQRRKPRPWRHRKAEDRRHAGRHRRFPKPRPSGPAGNGRRGQSLSRATGRTARAEDGDGATSSAGTAGRRLLTTAPRRSGAITRPRGGTGSAAASTEANGAGTDGSGSGRRHEPRALDQRPSGARGTGGPRPRSPAAVHGAGSRHVRPASGARRAGRLGRHRGPTAGPRPAWPAGRPLPHVRARRA